MDLKQLEYYAVVVREGGFSRAARRLHVGQPALSRQVQALEREMGVKLLVRAAGGVTPTDAGRRLAEMVGELLLYADSIRPAVQEIAARVSGVISVGVSPSLVPALAEHLTAALRNRYPLLNVKVVEALPMFLLEWLETERLDVVIFTRWPNARFGSAVEHTSIGWEEVLLVAARDALPVTADQGLSQDLVLRTLRLALTPGFRLLARERLDLDSLPQQLGPEIDSVHTIKDLVLRGEACSALPFTYVREDLTSKRLGAASFRPALRREVIAVTRARRRTAAGVDAVIDASRRRLAELVAGQPPTTGGASP